MDRVKTLLKVVRERGVAPTVAAAAAFVADLWLDFRYGTDTVSWVRIEDMKIESAHRERAVDYEPTQRLPLMKLLRTLEIPRDRVFLDLGSGKGKAMLIAAEFGFDTVRGVDFSPELSQAAEENCAQYRRRLGSTARLQVIESCVTQYEFTDESVIYLFNPFDGLVLDLALGNLMSSLQQNPRRLWIIYRRPLHRAVIEKYEGIRLVGEYLFWGSDFVVYTVG